MSSKLKQCALPNNGSFKVNAKIGIPFFGRSFQFSCFKLVFSLIKWRLKTCRIALVSSKDTGDTRFRAGILEALDIHRVPKVLRY